MLSLKHFIISLAIVAVIVATPVDNQNNPMDNIVDEMRSNCENGLDSMACVKLKVMNFLETIFKKENYQISNDIEVRTNGYVDESGARGQGGFMERIEEYLRGHDITFKFPVVDAQVTVSPKNLNNEEINLKIKYPFGAVTEARKSKLKKIAIPLMVIILLKAMTVIPMALGILGLKAWNSLQLGFVSFVVSVGLAIFQLCKKLASDHHHAHIAAHGPWDGRSILEDITEHFDAQNLAYQAYA